MRKNTTHSGFTLVETMLSAFVIAGLLLAVSLILSRYADRLLARTMAQYTTQVRQAMEDLLLEPQYFRDIYDAAALTPNGVLETNIDDIRNGTIPVPGLTIPPANNMDISFIDNTFFANGLNVFIRVADDRANPNDIESLEMIITSNDQLPYRRAFTVAENMGGYGGLVEDTNNDGIINGGDRNSVYGSWVFDINLLAGTPWFTQATGGGAAFPARQNGVYLMAYQFFNFNDVTGDYLYRVDLGDPELNRMYTNLDMGNNNIYAVDDIGGDPAIPAALGLESGPMTVGSRAVLLGSALTVTGNMQINQGNLDAAGTLSTRNITVSGLGNNTDVTGNFVTNGTLNVANRATTDRLSADSATFNGGLTVNNTVDTLQANVRGNITADTNSISQMDITGSSSLNVTQDLATGNMTVNGPTRVTGAMGAETVRTNTMGVNGTFTAHNTMQMTTMQTNFFGACDNGC